MTSEMIKSIDNAPQTETVKALVARTPYDKLVSMTLKTVSANSARVYGVTYSAWSQWCQDNGLEPTDLNAGNVCQFITDAQGTLATRNRQMSALRKLAEILAILDGDLAKINYEILKRTKAPKPSKATASNERNKRALNPSEANRLLEVHALGTDTLNRRNMAIVSTLLFTGMRRSELAVLEWRDIDLEIGTILIRDGKGDKSRTVAIIDNTAIDALKAWKSVSNAVSKNRVFVFCAVSQKGECLADAPITDKTVERVVQSAGRKADIGAVNCHDLRRTHITEMGRHSDVKTAQAQAGHVNGQTTMIYMQAVDAESRRADVHFRFGGVKIAKPELL